MRTVYATRFTVESKSGDVPVCLEELKAATASWVSRKYDRAWASQVDVNFDSATTTPLAGHSLLAQHRQAAGADLVSIEWSHPHDLDQTVRWVTSVTIAQSGGQVELSLVLRISATKFQIRPLAFEIGTPKLLVDVVSNYDCAIDGSSIPRAVRRLAAPQVAAFVSDLLLAPNRNLPIVLASPDAGGS